MPDLTSIRSLGYRTDLAVLAFEGRLEDRGDHWHVETPDNPGFYWGNLLLFKAPPGPEAADAWPRLFEAAFAHQPAVRHMTFGWDAPDGEPGDIAALEALGLEREDSVVLVSRAPSPPPRPCAGLVVRPLVSDAEWEAATELQIACRGEGFDEGDYRRFKQGRMAFHRRLAHAGHGDWYGAFLDGTLVGDAGLVVTGSVARFQSVETHPGFRRRGVCGTLIYEMAKDGIDRLGARQLVIVAEPEAEAARVYASVGFSALQRQVGLCRRPQR